MYTIEQIKKAKEILFKRFKVYLSDNTIEAYEKAIDNLIEILKNEV